MHQGIPSQRRRWGRSAYSPMQHGRMQSSFSLVHHHIVLILHSTQAIWLLWKAETIASQPTSAAEIPRKLLTQKPDSPNVPDFLPQ